jgi:hypothetical protein
MHLHGQVMLYDALRTSLFCDATGTAGALAAQCIVVLALTFDLVRMSFHRPFFLLTLLTLLTPLIPSTLLTLSIL